MERSYQIVGNCSSVVDGGGVQDAHIVGQMILETVLGVAYEAGVGVVAVALGNYNETCNEGAMMSDIGVLKVLKIWNDIVTYYQLGCEEEQTT